MSTMEGCLLDFSFLDITDPADLEGEEPREQKGKKFIKEKVIECNEDGEEVETEKYKSNCLRLSNNHICEHSGLWKIMSKMIVDPLAIYWIDLSVNDLPKIDPVICEFSSLSILYLHGNNISDLGEVEKLENLPKLKKLSLHCNPISQQKNYRFIVLSMLPDLKNFDMSPVTKSDRATAMSCKKSNRNNKKKTQSNND